MNCIININKPKGMTSHDVVSFVRRFFNIKKVGHTGTLDPDATGVLPICVGKATKASEMIMSTEKGYCAVMVLGITTTTQDASGEILQKRDVELDANQIISAVGSFTGWINQIPPMYSAIKIGGKKLYQIAREGKTVERIARKTEIKSLDVLDIDFEKNSIMLDIKCSKGTYIRTLCADIGEKLGCGAHMSELVRTQSGRFKIEDSVTLEELKEAEYLNTDKPYITKLEDLFSEYKKTTVSGKNESVAKNGGSPLAAELNNGEVYRVYAEDGSFLSLSEVRDGYLKIIKNFY